MPHRVRFLVFPGFQILDLTGPVGAFEMAGRPVPLPAYQFEVVSRDGGLVTSSSGVAVQTVAFPPTPADTLTVTGGLGTYAAATCPRTLAYVRDCGAGRTASVCSGAFLLAAAGLLDDKRATTHWRVAAELQRRFPKVRVEPDRIFVRDGPVWTSAGITAGIDLALALVAEDLGEPAARAAARELVVFHRRPGGQSQFSELVELGASSNRIARVLDKARRDLTQDLSVERLAETAGLSQRQFSRLFRAETGQTPARAVERLRVEAARAAVEEGRTSFAVIARATGFADADRLRRAFLRTLGRPPQSLRRDGRDATSVQA